MEGGLIFSGEFTGHFDCSEFGLIELGHSLPDNGKGTNAGVLTTWLGNLRSCEFGIVLYTVL